MATSFENRLAQVHEGIEKAAVAAGRTLAQIQLVAVAKTAQIPDLEAAWRAGQRVFGHNRVQLLSEHFAVLPDARWHLIGPLQRNKARKALAMVSMVETLADLRLAEALDRISAEVRTSPLPVLVQVNLCPQDGRPGRSPDQLEALLEALAGHPHLRVDGLMSMAPQQATDSQLHSHFAAIQALADQFSRVGLLPPSPQLSMGMSQDYLIAIEEGATLVRIGRALFPPAEINP
jgi:PLP dependent protein